VTPDRACLGQPLRRSRHRLFFCARLDAILLAVRAPSILVCAAASAIWLCRLCSRVDSCSCAARAACSGVCSAAPRCSIRRDRRRSTPGIVFVVVVVDPFEAGCCCAIDDACVSAVGCGLAAGRTDSAPAAESAPGRGSHRLGGAVLVGWRCCWPMGRLVVLVVRFAVREALAAPGHKLVQETMY